MTAPTTFDRYRGGYWLLNIQFGTLALAGLALTLIATGVAMLVTGSTGAGIAMVLAGVAIAASGLTGFVLQRRWFVEIDDRSRAVTISTPRSTVTLPANAVIFLLPRKASLFPSMVRYKTLDSPQSRTLIGLSQGQSKTPSQLTSLAAHLQRNGTYFEWK